jgi:uncharacterized protein YggE
MNTFDQSALRPRRWLHLPSLAVIAAAGAFAFAADRAVDGWTAVNEPPPRVASTGATERAGDQARVPIVGLAERQFKPVRAAWSVTLVTRGRDEQQIRADLAKKRVRVVEQLTALGATMDELWFEAAEVEERTRTLVYRSGDDYTDREVPDGYEATQKLELRSADIARVLDLHRRAQLVLGGHTIEAPVCEVVPERKHLAEQRELALTDARRKAEQAIARLGNARLGRLVNFSVTATFEGRSQSSEYCDAATLEVQASAIYQLLPL